MGLASVAHETGSQGRITMSFSSDFFYSVTLVFLISCSALTSSQDQDDDCPFTDGSCPVTLDNVVDVFFHDIADRRSCQRECQQIEDCKFFTMFGEKDSPTDHMKCFLFRKCDTLEPCNDCTTGPDYPPINNCTVIPPDNYTCGTTLDNIVDVFFFDAEDTFSCKDQCQLLDDCNFWTMLDVPDPTPHHKCFLYKNCNEHE